MSNGARNRISLALAVFAAVALALGALVTYAGRVFFDSDRFADRAEATLASEPVRDLLGTAIAREVVAVDPNAIAVKPVIETVAAGAVGSKPFRSAFRTAVDQVHRAVIEGDEESAILVLADVGNVIAGALQTAAPKVAKRIPQGLDVRLLAAEDAEDKVSVQIAGVIADVETIKWVLLALALVLGASAIGVSPSRRVGVGRVAWSIAATSLALVFLLAIARHLLIGQFGNTAVADAAAAIWDELMGTARIWYLVLALTGVVTASAAASALRPINLEASLRRAWEFATRRRVSGFGRALHAAVLIVTGALIVTNRVLFLDLVALAVGAFVIYAGSAELMRLTMAAGDAERPAGPGEAARRAGRGVARVFRIGIVAGALIGAGLLLAALFGGSDRRPPNADPAACNGSAALCDRTLDHAVFAGTHNSMSAATNPDWLFAQQERGMGAQLADGIRALLFDTHYGIENSRGVITDLERGDGSRRKLEQALGAQATAAAERLRDRILGGGEGKPGVYLCHGFCELGAIDAVEALAEVREFLERNPDEVVLFSIEDATSAADTAKVIEDAGLLDYVYQGPDEAAWPTLRELIADGTRLVVMAEKNGGQPPWLRDQFSLVRETPYTFKSPAELEARSSCDGNRGEESNPFLLLNHWVDTSPAPRPSNARVVNAKEFLLDRIERCQRARGDLPSIVAVDFYREGSVMEVVEKLNG